MSNENDYDSVPSGPSASLAYGCDGCCYPPPDPPECPNVIVESKSGCGSASRPAPCGFYNPDDELYYLVKTTTVVITTRDIDPAPPTCWYTTSTNLLDPPGTVRHNVRTVFDTDTDTFTYDSLEVITYTLDENCECADVDVDTTTDTYDLHDYIYSSSTVVEPPGSVPGGCVLDYSGDGQLDEIDPDNSSETIEYTVPWTCDFDTQAAATAAMEEEFAAAEWVGSDASASAEVTADADGTIISSSICKADIRIRLVGGNTGYVRVDWETRDQDDTVVSSGYFEHTWEYDVEAELDYTIDVTTLEVDFPTEVPDETTLNSLTLWITSVTCEPP